MGRMPRFLLTAILAAFAAAFASTADADLSTNAEHALLMDAGSGQVLWQKLTSGKLRAYWLLLDAELREGIPGEIDEEAVREKRALLGARISASSRRRLERYGRASFARTAAEYVHSLWHEVRVIDDPDNLPAPQVKRRLELLQRWFPPNRGYRLYPARV